jgi:hypothetical protein
VKRLRNQIDKWVTGHLSPRAIKLGEGKAVAVSSKSELGVYYIVFHVGVNRWACSCKGYRFASRHDGLCEHIDIARSILKGE